MEYGDRSERRSRGANHDALQPNIAQPDSVRPRNHDHPHAPLPIEVHALRPHVRRTLSQCAGNPARRPAPDRVGHPDKYDRYLADVFLELKSGETLFLNNALLENGHADRMDGDAPHDWLL